MNATTITGTCKHCGLRDQFFGPATVIFHMFDGTEDVCRYVNCKRCGSVLVVGRDVQEVRHAVV